MESALVYDWLVTMGGGEKTLAAIYEVFPSPIYTLLQRKVWVAQSPFKEAEIHTSFLQNLPFSDQYYRQLLPLFPRAIGQFDLSAYPVVISVSHAVARGVRVHPDQLHLCYCYTPMRYAWDLMEQYLEGMAPLKRMLAQKILLKMRAWDAASVSNVDHFIAISAFVAERIRRIYGREADVIYPPVDTDQIAMGERKEDFYLTVSRMVPYKRIDLIVESFAHTPERKLVVIGEGPEMARIRAKAGPNVEFLGHQKDAVVYDYMRRARGFIFAAEEDFGIVVLEAQAAGTPVIAFGRGGALETVVDGQTGLFFSEQSPKSLLEALERFERMEFDPNLARAQALRFSRERFKQEFRQLIENQYESRHSSRR